MENEKIINLIDRFLSEYKAMEVEVKKHQLLKDLYDELLKLIDNDYETLKTNKEIIVLLLNEIYKDNFYLDEFYILLWSMRKSNNEEVTERYQQLVEMIMNDSIQNDQKLDELNLRIFRNRFIPSSAKRVKVCLRHNIPINQDKYDVSNIKRILNYYEASGVISNKEEILLINAIELYNRRLTTKESNNPKEKEYVEELYNQVPNIIDGGFQQLEEIEVNDERRVVLDKIVKEIYGYINYFDGLDIVDAIARYREYNLDDNEYSYIVTSVLNKYLDELLTYYGLLTDKEIYINRKDRLDTIKSYYSMLDKYLILMKHYNEINDFRPDDDDDNPKLPDEDAETRQLVFSHSDNSDKAKIITDMKDVPHEYYDTVLELINSFINNKLSKKEIKSLKNNGKLTQFIELKYDQVRIVLKHLKDNIYCVMGIGVKKDNNDMVMYSRLANRKIPNIQELDKLKKELELSEIVKKDLDTLVKTKGRKGTR